VSFDNGSELAKQLTAHGSKRAARPCARIPLPLKPVNCPAFVTTMRLSRPWAAVWGRAAADPEDSEPAGLAVAVVLAAGLIANMWLKVDPKPLRRVRLHYLSPPPTISTSPVSQRESFEAKKAATSAMSSGWPMRPSGVCATRVFSRSEPT
jgi:hypothetical protein